MSSAHRAWRSSKRDAPDRRRTLRFFRVDRGATKLGLHSLLISKLAE
jgi:hypothetical protein